MCALVDNDNNRMSTKQFAVTTAWNRIEINVPADTTGALDDDNAGSFNLNFYLHGGSDITGGTYTASTWGASTDANRAVGISSFFDATSRTFFLTGVQLEVGSSATPFEHKTFAQDLEECSRYFTIDKAGSGGQFKRYAHGGAVSTTQASCSIALSTPLRTNPTLVLSGAASTFLGHSAGGTDALTGLIIATDDDAGTFNRMIELTPTVSSGFVAGDVVSIISNNSVSTSIALDAEL